MYIHIYTRSEEENRREGERHDAPTPARVAALECESDLYKYRERLMERRKEKKKSADMNLNEKPDVRERRVRIP